MATSRIGTKEPFEKCLPERISPRSDGSYRLGLIQLASFIRGHVCLADLEEFRKDPTYTKVDGEYQVTSAQFKVTSKMRRDIQSNIKAVAKNLLVQIGMSAPQIAEAKLKLDATMKSALTEQPFDSKVVCSVTPQ